MHEPNPKWDFRFLEMAKLVSTWSRDPSTKCGAVIVRPDKTIVSVGFNGFAKCMIDTPEYYDDREEKYSRIIHAEVNAQLHAFENLKDCILYTYPLACCDRCVVQMLQAGIYAFVFPEPTADVLSRWGAAIKKTKLYIQESSAEYWEYKLEN